MKKTPRLYFINFTSFAYFIITYYLDISTTYTKLYTLIHDLLFAGYFLPLNRWNGTRNRNGTHQCLIDVEIITSSESLLLLFSIRKYGFWVDLELDGDGCGSEYAFRIPHTHNITAPCLKGRKRKANGQCQHELFNTNRWSSMNSTKLGGLMLFFHQFRWNSSINLFSFQLSVSTDFLFVSILIRSFENCHEVIIMWRNYRYEIRK